MTTTPCGTSLTLKVEGTEPFRCTLPEGHISPRHQLVQAGTGKRREMLDPAYCTPGRWMVLTYQTV